MAPPTKRKDLAADFSVVEDLLVRDEDAGEVIEAERPAPTAEEQRIIDEDGEIDLDDSERLDDFGREHVDERRGELPPVTPDVDVPDLRFDDPFRPPPKPPPPAKLPRVEWLTGVQARLLLLGYKTGLVDGIMGPKTRAAVRAFQLDHDLRIDGIPGPKTQARLREVVGR